jgi:hypothetical protein
MGRKPRAGEVYTPIDERTGEPPPNLVIIQRSLEQLLDLHWRQRLPRTFASQQQRWLQFARWWLEINAGKPLADILKEEGVAPAKHAALRRGFEHWRRAEEKKRRA